MAYSDFTIEQLEKQFGLVEARTHLFVADELPAVSVSERLLADITEGLEFPVFSEKAKSEILIMPVLREIRRLSGNRFSIFSGYTFEVDPVQGLTGICDYLFTTHPRSNRIKSPVFCAVEAKSRSVEEGIAQAGAEMYAAQLYNQRDGNPTDVVFGCVTNAYEWLFLRLEGNSLQTDVDRYFLDTLNLPRLLAVLNHITSLYQGMFEAK
ncbi:MAG: hypothetical protein EAZ91_25950 [Cytophagales bacterium]|nr:MAG: hypothetical protein EAZ91_25950 [Cytophagales bacterium]